MNPIFSDKFLASHLADFSLASIPGIRDSKIEIDRFIQEIKSGKIASLKEEEVKTRFLETLFGKILGFNYGNANHWLMREEKKSTVDGKKADAVLGFFSKINKADDVRALIEVKDANTDLDAKQNRAGGLSPVDQAFSYVSRMGGKCEWVIVTNLLEVRFYPSRDIKLCQVYKFIDLQDETKLKELLYLFHKDRFIHMDISPTDILFKRSKDSSQTAVTTIHIIDQLYDSLKRFEGFGFVDPSFIANLPPFNILKKRVWQYERGNILSINPAIFHLLKNIEVENGVVGLSEVLKQEVIDNAVVDAEEKLRWVFTFLNHSMVSSLSAVENYANIDKRNAEVIGYSSRYHFDFKKEEGVIIDIHLIGGQCNCMGCQFRSFDFKSLLQNLKSAFGSPDFDNLEYAFGNYLVGSNNYKTAFLILKSVSERTKGLEKRQIEYFLARQNIAYLRPLLGQYNLGDGDLIREESRTIDLDKVIYHEIEFSVDAPVKNYLVKVKEENLVYRLQDKIETTYDKIVSLYELYENGGSQFAGADQASILIHDYITLYLHINRNFIIYDFYHRYRALTTKVFKGLVTSYVTPEVGFSEFDTFLLTEAILHINPADLRASLKNAKELKCKDNTAKEICIKLDNFCKSFYSKSFLGTPLSNSLMEEHLANHMFRSRISNIFTNTLILLKKIELTKDEFSACKKSLLDFLPIENVLGWTDLKELGSFIDWKGDLFDPGELNTILEISVNRSKYGNNKYNDIIELITPAIAHYYPEFKITNRHLVETIILKNTSDDGQNIDAGHLIPFIDICDHDLQQVLFAALDASLSKKFVPEIYEKLLWNNVLNFDIKNYFEQYCQYVNTHRHVAFKTGKSAQTDIIFMHFISIVYRNRIDVNREEMKLITNLSLFENWLIKPDVFPYEQFDPYWLIDVQQTWFMDRLAGIKAIPGAINTAMRVKYDDELARIKHIFFSAGDTPELHSTN